MIFNIEVELLREIPRTCGDQNENNSTKVIMICLPVPENKHNK